MIKLKYVSESKSTEENLEIVVEAETATQAIKEFQKLLPDYAENMGWGVVGDSKAPETAKNSPSSAPAPAPTTQLEPVMTMFNPYNEIQIVLTYGESHPSKNWRDLEALALRLEPAFHAEMKKLNPPPFNWSAPIRVSREVAAVDMALVHPNASESKTQELQDLADRMQPLLEAELKKLTTQAL